MVVATGQGLGVPFALITGTAAGLLSVLSRSVFRGSPLRTVTAALGTVMGIVAVYHGLLFVTTPESVPVVVLGSGKYVAVLVACWLMLRLYGRMDVPAGEYRDGPRLVAIGVSTFVLLGVAGELFVPELVHWIHGLTALIVVGGLYRIVGEGVSTDRWADRLVTDPVRFREAEERDWMTPLDDAILDLCSVSGLVLTPAVIAVNIDYSREEVNRRLTTLESRGFVERVERGKYRITTRGERYVAGSVPAGSDGPPTDRNR